jgi:predicted alpha/beta hydrolase family esterase
MSLQEWRKMKVIFIPGNGGGGPNDNWFPYLKKELEKLGVTVIASEFPDNIIARESYWIPFLKNQLQTDEQTVLVGHSSGAIAAMRFAETHQLLGSVLVGAYHSDLGLPMEKQSGYFNRPWNWESIIQNQKWIIQFASLNDPWIPIEEARFVRDKLKTDYHEFIDQGHFGGDTNKLVFPELLDALKSKLQLK